MPRKLIKRYLPDPKSVKENKFLSIFGKLIHDPQLWHLTRYSVSNAFVVGLFCAFIPVPFQMVIAAAGAVVFRANIVISIALCWITNPLTIPFLFGFAYLVGIWTLGDPTSDVQSQLSYQWFVDNLNVIWQPFLLGCFICAVVSAILGFITIRIFWRLHISKAWQERLSKRKQKNEST